MLIGLRRPRGRVKFGLPAKSCWEEVSIGREKGGYLTRFYGRRWARHFIE